MTSARRIVLIALVLPLLTSSPAFATGDPFTFRNDGTVIDERTGETAASASGGVCDMQGFKNALAGRESSGDCAARREGSQFLGKYQLGKREALADINWTDENGNWINGMNDQMYLNSCEIQEQAMDAWIVTMAGYINGARTGSGQQLTSYLGQPIPHCPEKKLTFSGLLGGRHLCGLGYVASKATSGKCYVLGYTGLIAYFESGGAKNGVDGLSTPVSEYICKFNGYQTPHDQGGDFSSCGGGASYGGTPGGSKIDYDPVGGYGEDFWNPNPEVRHYNLLSNAIIRVWLAGLALMTNQMVDTMMMQAEIIGSFFDAKHQLESQRLLQQKTARAHKDYHPSEQMCTIGTFARTLMDTDRRAQFSQAVLAERGIQRELMRGENLAVESRVSDRQSRFETFRKTFCNPKDNAGTLAAFVCEGGADPAMMNRDIDFTRTIDLPLTLAVDPLEPSASDAETAVYALMDNLFQHEQLSAIQKDLTTLEDFQDVYMDLRSISAMRATARNSMNNIIAQKSYGPKTAAESNAPFLRALIKDMGITDEADITRILGERPSYYAQMEVLTKTLYQHPEFVVNLYDKPANVARMRAAMRAVKVMQDRDIHEALMRREILVSMLAELSVRRQQDRINTLVRSIRIDP